MLPLTVRIKNRSYIVKPLSAAAERRGKMVGDCDPASRTIRVSCRQLKEDVASTLLHEILHGMMIEYKIDLPDDEEEALVLTLEEALYQVLRDNRGALKYILGD
jgi:hypothetical protein